MNIIHFKDATVRLELAYRLIDQKRYLDAAILMEKITQKNLAVLMALQECYTILGRKSEKINILEQIALHAPTKLVISELITLLEKNSQKARALHWAQQGVFFFPQDPDFKKQVLELLIEQRDFIAAKAFLKSHYDALSYEKRLYFKALLSQQTGAHIKAWYFFKKLSRNFPFNILYRYLLATSYENLNLKRKSQREFRFIEDFIKQVPRIIQFQSESAFSNILQHLLLVK